MAEQKFLGQAGTDVIIDKIKELSVPGLTIRPNFYPDSGAMNGWLNNAIHICSLYHSRAGILNICGANNASNAVYKAVVYCDNDYKIHVLSTIYCKSEWDALYDLIHIDSEWAACPPMGYEVGSIGRRYPTESAADIQEITAQEVTDAFNT